jgi:hypothetical protein
MINFFDLGTWEGDTTNKFILAAALCNMKDYQIYGFEAFPATFKKVRRHFRSAKNIHMMQI